jgi:hypothetical protein
MTNRFAGLGFLALVLTASAAGAQRGTSRPIEFGVDGGITIGFDDPNTTVVSIPQAVRVGFFMTDRVSLEPRLNFNSFSQGDASLRTYAAELGVLFHPGGYRSGSPIYIRPFIGVEGRGGSGPDDSDVYLGAGVGVKLPFWDRRFAARLEANLAQVFDEGDNDTRLGLLFGISVFNW